jgi:glutamate/tyrosine decarboxylase-like PLP-dependent enzyme
LIFSMPGKLDEASEGTRMKQDRTSLFEHAFKIATAYDRQKFARPPRATVNREQLLEGFGGLTPEGSMDETEVLTLLAEIAEPGLQVSTGSRFFGWVLGGVHPLGMAAEWLNSVWGQNCANYECAPSASVVEEVAGTWLKDILGLPGECSVGFTTGATMANFTALAAARSELLRRQGWNVEDEGLQGSPDLRVLIGEDAHTTVFVALSLLGLGRRRITRIATDSQGRMRSDALAEHLKPGDVPAIVIAQAGQINTGAMDPFSEIAPLVQAHGSWLHVDGAFGLWARASKTKEHLLEGVEKADSWATDGHKWLQVPYDSGFVFVKHPEAHRRSMAATASYLPADDAIRDPSHYVPELSRRARGFAVWAIIKAMGRVGIAAMVDRHCDLAQHLARKLGEEPGIEVINEVTLNQLILGFDDDVKCREMLQRLADENRFLLGGAEWRGRWVMRISVISYFTESDDIDELVGDIIRIWRACR